MEYQDTILLSLEQSVELEAQRLRGLKRNLERTNNKDLQSEIEESKEWLKELQEAYDHYMVC